MAKAKTIRAVTLVLEPAEARALRLVLGHVGGNPATTARCYIDGIRDALDKNLKPREVATTHRCFDGPYASLYLNAESLAFVRKEGP